MIEYTWFQNLGHLNNPVGRAHAVAAITSDTYYAACGYERTKPRTPEQKRAAIALGRDEEPDFEIRVWRLAGYPKEACQGCLEALTPHAPPRYIATDDREIERVDAACNHRKCPPGECIAYNDATLQITEADEAKARELVAAGWWSTSAKYRTIARWKERVPAIEELILPEMLDTFHGRRLAEVIRKHEKWRMDVPRFGPEFAEHCEEAVLSPSLFRAFKKAGGECGR